MKTITEIRKALVEAVDALEALDHRDSVLANRVAETQAAIERLDRVIVRRQEHIFNPA